MHRFNKSTYMPGKLRNGISGRFASLKSKGRAGEIIEREEERMVHGHYGASLLHPLWKAKRQKILERDAFRCANCRSDLDLQVHHRQYHFMVHSNGFKDPWDYADNLLVTLCRKCNASGHQQFTIPIIQV